MNRVICIQRLQNISADVSRFLLVFISVLVLIYCLMYCPPTNVFAF